MSDSWTRYLGFAFASADLLLEIEANERVGFALGAIQRALGRNEDNILGRHWRELVATKDRILVGAILDSLEPGGRRGPVRIELSTDAAGSRGRSAAFSACRLPQNDDRISCVFSLTPGLAVVSSRKDDHGLLDSETFVEATGQLLAAARSSGLDIGLQFVEVKGLTAAEQAASPEKRKSLLGRISAALRAESYAGDGAARVGDDRFVLVREGKDDPGALLGRLERAASAEGAETKAASASLAFNADDAPLAQLKALRFALDSFLKSDVRQAEAAFKKVLESTVAEANAVAAAVRDRSFKLLYQPIVELASGELQHFEALLRLDGHDSPAEAIHLAEQLDLVADLDLAVLDEVIAKLKSSRRDVRLAANISGRSLALPRFLDAALAKLRSVGFLSSRLMLEITETAALGDLGQANAAIQQMRKLGHRIFLDDFGAGAASMAYLRALSVDAVKVDGQYVRDLQASERNRALVRHIAELCRELDVDVVAEHVETQEAAAALQELGVRFGQGWRFGKPTAEPVYRGITEQRVRRIGEVAA
jgi:EAL domain-containing protein (putative c-di-GMP-specific phosphodiesterase class I)